MPQDVTKFIFNKDVVGTKATSAEAQNLMTQLQKFDKIKKQMEGAMAGRIQTKSQAVISEIQPGMSNQANAIQSLADELKKAITRTDSVDQSRANALNVNM